MMEERPYMVCGTMFKPRTKQSVTYSDYCKRQRMLQQKKETYVRYKEKHGLVEFAPKTEPEVLPNEKNEESKAG